MHEGELAVIRGVRTNNLEDTLVESTRMIVLGQLLTAIIISLRPKSANTVIGAFLTLGAS